MEWTVDEDNSMGLMRWVRRDAEKVCMTRVCR